ncbi:hypothetical protein BOTBODRAFT_182738 [Botryobasidium botryosum FD-172 SS1]|uniref:BHLH domain-containing protein n=1 Tax=Botryobasidium botryosum (strain FD-172 SS1) TaxID=930990 RepID=A0A067NCB1_BOTB1|nr:hypothetical protein BOTBODRAFT_182738 [Botryobasidium botryosum FD-172 SS1]
MDTTLFSLPDMDSPDSQPSSSSPSSSPDDSPFTYLLSNPSLSDASSLSSSASQRSQSPDTTWASDAFPTDWKWSDMDLDIASLASGIGIFGSPDSHAPMSIDPHAMHIHDFDPFSALGGMGNMEFGLPQQQQSPSPQDILSHASFADLSSFTYTAPSVAASQAIDITQTLSLPAAPPPSITVAAAVASAVAAAQSDAMDATLSSSSASEAEEIAARVRELVGIVEAVTQNSSPTAPAAAAAAPVQAPTPPPVSAPKVAIPRLPRPAVAVRLPNLANTGASTGSSKSSSPNTTRLSTPVDSPACTSPSTLAPAPTGAAAPTTTTTARPKSSHTTIERRYRTNLNARITALKHAVPALRVLESAKFPDCVPDERGYVDGVKAARKASKASVLGKAVEYIRVKFIYCVLKKREIRLRRDTSGLRALIQGLVGGPALLARWEAEWTARFGGEEADEVQGSDGEGDDGEGEGDEEGSEDDDESGGGPRKKGRVGGKEKEIKPKKAAAGAGAGVGEVPQSAGVVGPNGEVIGKRKRGRPRKVQPAPVPVVIPAAGVSVNAAIVSSAQGHQQSGGTGTYLLGVFLFFSFFKSDGSSSSSSSSSDAYAGAATHVGTVLSASPVLNSSFGAPGAAVVEAGWTWTWVDAMHTLHTIISVLLLLSLVLPFLPQLRRRQQTSCKDEDEVHALEEKVQRTRDIKRALESGSRAAILRALGMSAGEAERVGVWDVLCEGGAWARSWVSWSRDSDTDSAHDGEGEGEEDVEKDAWVKLAQLDLSKGRSLSFSRRLHTALALSNRLSASPSRTSAADLGTLALLVYPISAVVAGSVWTRARRVADGDVAPATLAEGDALALDIAEAESILCQCGMGVGVDGDGASAPNLNLNPLEAIARAQVVDVVKRVAARMFVDLVSDQERGRQDDGDSGAGGESESDSDDIAIPVPASASVGEEGAGSERARASASESLEDEKLTLQIGKTMDGYVGKMIRVLERLGTCTDLSEVDEELDLDLDEDLDATANVQSHPSARVGGGNTERVDSSKGSLLDDATSLLRALVLFRRVFPSHHAQRLSQSHPASPMSSSGTLTPTPSTPTATLPSFLISGPGSVSGSGITHRHGHGAASGDRRVGGGARKDSPLLVLSRVLAAPVFDQESEIEDARDRVVDMLADARRRRS